MKKKEFEEEGDIKIREIIDGISKMRKKYDVTFPENKKTDEYNLSICYGFIAI